MLERKNRNELTAGEVFEGAAISPVLFAISSNAETASAACSRSPLAKLSIFLSTLERVASVVESSIQTYASCSMYRFLISSYLSPSVSA